VEVKNTGNNEAVELVQLYVHRVKSKIFYPEKELKAFAHVPLKAGETKTVTLEVPVASLRYWDEKKSEWALEKGKIEILVGASSGDIRQTAGVEIMNN
jgi:beta-glucosidase